MRFLSNSEKRLIANNRFTAGKRESCSGIMSNSQGKWLISKGLAAVPPDSRIAPLSPHRAFDHEARPGGFLSLLAGVFRVRKNGF
jgi:hypothetical protein